MFSRSVCKGTRPHALLLCSSDVGSPQNALRLGYGYRLRHSHSRLNRTSHRTAEGNPALELQGYVFGNKLSTRSGRFTSWMSKMRSFPIILLSSSFSFSSSVPLRPMTTPGRAVKIFTRIRLLARSMKIRGTDAKRSFFSRKLRIS